MASRKRLSYEAFDRNCDDWLKKCIKCKHMYVKKEDIDTVHCSAKKVCHFEECKTRKELENANN